MILWIIGLSGTGKTTLAKAIVKKIRKNKKKVVHIDGDQIRKAFGNDLGYSPEDRKINAKRICSICKVLSDQNINVVCSILSVFESSRSWNRKNLKNYYEVYIKSSIKDLLKRDSKNLYSKFQKGKIKKVTGFDIKFEEPAKSNLVINNNSSLKIFLKYSDVIFSRIKSKL